MHDMQSYEKIKMPQIKNLIGSNESIEPMLITPLQGFMNELFSMPRFSVFLKGVVFWDLKIYTHLSLNSDKIEIYCNIPSFFENSIS